MRSIPWIGIRRRAASMQETVFVYTIYVFALGVGLTYLHGLAEEARAFNMFRELEAVHAAAKRFSLGEYGYRGLSTLGIVEAGLLPGQMALGQALSVMTAEGRLQVRVCGDQVCPPGGAVPGGASGALGFRTWTKPAGTDPRLSFGFSIWVLGVQDVGVCTRILTWRSPAWPERVGLQVQAGGSGSGVRIPSAVTESAFPPVAGCGTLRAVGWSVLNPAGADPVPWELEEAGPHVRRVTPGMASEVCGCMLSVGPVSVGLGFRNL